MNKLTRSALRRKPFRRTILENWGGRLSGRRSRDKGARAERALVHFLQSRGFDAARVPLSGAAGGRYVGDVTLPLLGRALCAEVKCRASGFAQLYGWLENRDLLVVRADRREPLVVLPLRLAADIAAVAERKGGAS